MKDKKQQIEEMARDIAKRDCHLYDNCPKPIKHNCVSQDPAVMLESSKNYITIATWLVNANYQKVDEDSVVLTKVEKQKLLHEMYEQGRFDALADLEKEGKVVLSHDEFVSFIKTDKEAEEYGQQCWNDGKAQGVREFADFIISNMRERDYMGIKYRQGIFSECEIDVFVNQFIDRYKGE